MTAGRPRTGKRLTGPAKILRDWRDRFGLNTAQAGAYLGLSQSSVEKIEQGKPFARSRLLYLALRNFERTNLDA